MKDVNRASDDELFFPFLNLDIVRRNSTSGEFWLKSELEYRNEEWNIANTIFKLYLMNKKNWCSYCDVYGCHSQRFLKFPDYFLTNVKFPWPTELTISQISPDDGLNTPPPPQQPDPLQPFIYAFSKAHAMYMN